MSGRNIRANAEWSRSFGGTHNAGLLAGGESRNIDTRYSLKEYWGYKNQSTPLFDNSFTKAIGGNSIRLNPEFGTNYNDVQSYTIDILDKWSSSGDEKHTKIPKILSKNSESSLNSDLYSLYNQSTLRVAKGDYIRLKEISIGYELPEKILSGIGLKKVSVALSATNLALLYSDKKLNGFDPEYYNTGGVSSPVPRQFTLTLRLGI